MRKILTLTFLVSLFFAAAQAQDVLVRKNGSIIEGKVVEVGIDKVSYKISEDANSANFLVRKNELLRIEFGNGQTIWFDKRNERAAARGVKERTIDPEREYGKNKIDVSPFKALDSGPGFGISYERILDISGYFGLLLPFTMTIPDDYYFPNGGFEGNDQHQMFYFSPTLKIYPFGQRRVTYAVGPTLYAGIGKRWYSYTNYDQFTGVYTTHEEDRKRFRMGLIVNNFVNFQITRQFQIGLNGGVGPRYVERETTPSGTYRNTGFDITGEFNFNLGFRF